MRRPSRCVQQCSESLCLTHRQSGGLQILFSLLKHLSDSLSTATNAPQIHVYVWRTIVRALLETSGLDLGEYLKYDDVRWLFLRDLT